jgi:hypothetical protein
MCIHSRSAPYKTDRERNYSAEGTTALSLSLYWNRWTSLGLLWRVAPAVGTTHMHDRCGSCLLLDPPVWNPIPDCWPWLAPLPLPSSHLGVWLAAQMFHNAHHRQGFCFFIHV